MIAPFAEFENWLNQKGLFHIDLRLKRVSDALGALGLSAPPFPVIQVLGTNGKGSTCAFLASLARAAGLEVGLYTSPHFVSIKERVLVNGAQASDAAWLEAANKLRGLPQSREMTYFECLTVLAAALFASQKVDLAIFEAGLGGRGDATSAIPAQIHCFAPVGVDHAAVIGPSLADIARDKADAIRAGARVFSAPQYPAAREVLIRAARARDAKLEFVEPLAKSVRLGLRGKFQLTNAALALAAWNAMKQFAISASRNEDGLATAFLPGRMQEARLDNAAFILDGAHNPHAIQSLLSSLTERPKRAIFSALADKNWRDCLGPILRLQIPVIIPQLGNARAARAAEIAAWANAVRPGSARESTDVATAVGICSMEGGLTLACGSLYLLSEFFALHPQFLKRN